MEGHKNLCSKNHTASSNAMEMFAAAQIWNRSKEYEVRIKTFISDGDSKTFQHLNSLEIYGKGVIIEKEECVNHISKRLWRALSETVSSKTEA